ncbi:unnamed protein product [Allacma fusca]|uniref:Uncharacterized protein n=1 Tax=Allacma fusca TaxID=39272 RepID=A0A8J2PQU7_9HEXA|nr:unnamed protein product [Allacma fusca]
MRLKIFNAFVKIAICLTIFLFPCKSTESVINVDICREETQNNESKTFCQCEEQVINCDFSSLESDKDRVVILNGWNDNANTNIRRFCLCGGPQNLVLVMSPNIFIGLRQLHRVDFFNIPGIIHLRNAFSSYFSGDFYASKVRINTIHPLQFGAADPFTIEDVSELKCCSEISVPQKFNHPTFYMEDSKIGKLSANGIHDSHLWKTFIWKNVSMNIDRYGVNLKNPGMNVSITGCTFNHTNETAITFKDADNIFLAKNSFTNQSTFYPLVLKSTRTASTVFMLENYFNDKIIIDIDARKVLALFNHFDTWDNYTFAHLNHTKHKDRFYVMALNSIRNASKFQEYSIPNGSSQEFRHFYANILGSCTCEGTKVKLPAILKDTRCDYTDSENNTCNPTIESASNKCVGNERKMGCSSEDKVLSQVSMDYLKMIKGLLRVHNKMLNSPFIENMLLLSPDPYEIFEEDEEDAEIRRNNSEPNLKSIYPLITALYMFCFICSY